MQRKKDQMFNWEKKKKKKKPKHNSHKRGDDHLVKYMVHSPDKKQPPFKSNGGTKQISLV